MENNSEFINKSPRSHEYRGWLRRTMTKHPELWAVFAAVIFTLCTKYTYSQERVLLAPQPHPRRFFPSTSPVLDFPYGNLGAVSELLEDHELLFVMYYAPWCAKSLRSRHEFERAATYMQDQFTFVGINCWYSSGQCRQQNVFSAFPVLFAYHTTLDGFRYTGIVEADYMIAFLQRLLYPLSRLTTKDEIGVFLAQKDHAVVGFFDFHASPQPPGYDQFYYAAMRILEKDPANIIEFGVVTSRVLGESFKLATERNILMTRPHNDTLRYGQDRNFTSSEITKWVLSTRSGSSYSIRWLVPAGVKTLALSKEVQSGPTVIVFTPHSPVTSINQYFSMFREISLAYKNCHNLTRVENMIESSMYVRLANTMRHLENLDKCRKQNAAGPSPKHTQESTQEMLRFALSCCSSVVPSGVPTATNSCDVCTHYSPVHPLSTSHCPLLALPDLPWGEMLTTTPCTELRATYNPSEYISMCCHGHHQHLQRPYHPTLTPLPRTPSPFSSSQSPLLTLAPPTYTGQYEHYADPFVSLAKERIQAQRCRELRLQRTFGWLPLIHMPGLDLSGDVDYEAEGLSGLACQTNRSVRFLAMNAKNSGTFAERLGINLTAMPLHTAAVMIDEEVVALDNTTREAQYVLDGEVTRENVVTWLRKLTEGSIARHLRSERPASVTCDPASGDTCITELSSDTFSQVVMDQDKDVMVLYYSPWCGFCKGFAHTYLSLARYFKSAENMIFARINADRNDLPWEVTVDSYPTIHFFPARRKVDSVSFPEHLTKTLPNLLQFVLRYARSELRLQTSLSICSRACIHNNKVRTAHRLQELYGETHLLQRRAGLVAKRILALRSAAFGLTSPTTDSVMSTYRDSILALEGYLHTLHQKRRRKQLQLRSARQLHNALLTTQGLFIDKHKLTAIIRSHQQLKVGLREVMQKPGSNMNQHISDPPTMPRDEL